jgi:pheromone shutdown protein TraB
MRKLILSLALGLLTVAGVNAQEKGNWYIGTGDIANKAWTEWSVSPTVGYGLTDNLMVGLNVSQADSTADVALDLHARYFWKGYFAYVATTGLNTDNVSVGAGKIIANLTTLINALGNGGFVGLVVLVIVMSFFVKK